MLLATRWSQALTRRCLAKLATALFLVSPTLCPAEESDAPNVRDLVLAEQFASADALLEDMREKFMADIAFESDMYRLWDQFNRPVPELEEALTRWVESGDSANARLARGIHFTSMGWRARGAAFISSTSKAQLRGMEAYFSLALEDFQGVLEQRPDELFAYCYAIEVLMAFGADEGVQRLYAKALEEHPLAYTPRWFYLTTLAPWWGGSMQEIEQVVVDSRPFYDQNPELRALEGRATSVLAEAADSAGEFATALTLYNRALEQGGPNWRYLNGRGEMYMRLGRFEEAIADLNRVLVLRPDYVEALEHRSYSHYRRGQNESAIQDITRIIELGAGTARLHGIRGDAYRQLGRLDEALADVTIAIEMDPGAEVYKRDRERILASR
jgi:tetratricopeptide (TPR) repeat protein